MRLLLITIILGTLLGCSRTDESNLKTSDNVDSLAIAYDVDVDSLDFKIIPYDTAYHYIFPKTFRATDLSTEEIKLCEVLLKLFIADYNVAAVKRFEEMAKKYPSLNFNKEDFTIELQDYGRQYMAVGSGDKKFVYVNCFCDPQAFDYRDKVLVHVHDGGNCFFNFKVDLKEKRIFDFMENGVA